MFQGAGRIPWLLVLSCLALTTAGLAGLLRADELYGRTQLVERQLVWLMLAIPVMAVVAATPWRLLRVWSFPAYGASLMLLFLTLFMPAVNGARRWIPLGLFDLQASEPARLAFIMALAAWLMHRSSQTTVRGLLVPAVLALVPMLLILREPDLDTALLFVPVLGCMLYCAGTRVSHLSAVTLLLVVSLPFLWQQMSSEQKSRIVSVVVQRDGGSAPAGDGFHLHQSKQVLALGGLRGSLYEQPSLVDDPAAWQLPASRTDFIFVMIGERYGIAGCGLVLVLYTVLIWSGFGIAAAAREPWARLTAAGVTTLIGVQVVLNTSMTVGLLPITGTPLPLCSYGGSSLLCTYAAVGLLVNIRMHGRWEVASIPFAR